MTSDAPPFHATQTITYSIARALERASFYGVRGIILLYMIKSSLGFRNSDAINIYMFFVGGVVFTQIIGAIFGDLVFGNKRAVIIGGIIQAVGTFVLCIESKTGLYIGIVLISIGSGLFSPNMLAQFGKLYFQKEKLLDAGFTLFYTAINIGAFAGVALIGYTGSIDYRYGFIVAGILMIIACAVNLIHLKTDVVLQSPKPHYDLNRRTAGIVICIFIMTAFWSIYDVAGNAMSELDFLLQETSLAKVSIWGSSSALYVIAVGIIMSVLWTFINIARSLKMTAGFIFGALAFYLLSIINPGFHGSDLFLYIAALITLSIAEILLAPLLYSVIAKHANPKFLAIIMALAAVPPYISMRMLSDNRYLDGGPVFIICATLTAILAVIFIVIIVVSKKISLHNKDIMSN